MVVLVEECGMVVVEGVVERVVIAVANWMVAVIAVIAVIAAVVVPCRSSHSVLL